MAKRILLFLALIILATYVILLLLLCRPLDPSLDVCQVPSGLSVLAAAGIGAFTVLVFYYFVDKAQQETDAKIKDTNAKVEHIDVELTAILEKYARAYIVRTCLFNLQDIFKCELKPKPHDVVPNDENRLKFLRKLDEMYLQKFSNAEEDVREIYELAKAHPPIVYNNPVDVNVPNHAYKTCTYCRETQLLEKIQTYIDKHPNPGLED